MAGKNLFKIRQESASGFRHTVDRSYEQFDVSEDWHGATTTKRSQFFPEQKRLYIFSVILSIVLVVLIGRLFSLQIVQGQEYRDQAEGNYIRTQIVDAPRGLFLDREGEPLVRNEPQFYVTFIAADLPDEQIRYEQLTVISAITGQRIEELNAVIDATPRISFQPTPLVEGLSYEEVVQLRTQLDNWSGLELGVRGARYYTEHDSFSHILGYLGKISDVDLNNEAFADYQLTDYVGKAGLEQQYESVLRGAPGVREVEINVRGQVQKVLTETPTEAGATIKLTVDKQIQNKLFELLTNQLELLQKEKAVAVALDPRDGAVLAAVSLPSYDNNIFSGSIDADTYNQLITDENQPLFFRPLQGEYPSGSTFKPMIALAALEDGLIDATTSFLSQGGIQINQWFFPDWKAGGHGRTDVVKAIAESVNTFFYIIGGGYNDTRGLGIDGIVSFAKQLFFTQQLGIDYPSEADGFLPTQHWKETVKRERWYIGDTYNVSIGQGDVLVTPLQLASMLAYFANGGILHQPHFVQEIAYPDHTYKKTEPKVLQENIVSPQHIALVREGLKATVDWGSARSLSVFKPFQIAGKTGTAQVGGDKEPHAWFISFAPFANPEIALVILIENGDNTSLAAVPVAREFYQWYIDAYYTQ